MNPTYHLLEPEAFLKDVVSKIRSSKKRVYLITMILNDDEVTGDMFEALAEAAARGVTVHVTADTFTYAEFGINLASHMGLRSRISNFSGMRSRLIKKGVKFNWLGAKTTLFLAGRTHTKWVVVDDYVYSFGGINLYAKAFKHRDYMFRVHDEDLANRLVAEQKRIVEADKRSHVYRSHKFGNATHTVLVDGGAFADSIIYRRACELSNIAETITYVSQYCPTGKLSSILKKKQATLYFNPASRSQGTNSFIIRLGEFVSGLKSSYTQDFYLHAKFMLFTMPDGSKIALTGSHNFPRSGMWVGTREIALETTDRHIVKQLENFLEKYVV